MLVADVGLAASDIQVGVHVFKCPATIRRKGAPKMGPGVSPGDSAIARKAMPFSVMQFQSSGSSYEFAMTPNQECDFPMVAAGIRERWAQDRLRMRSQFFPIVNRALAPSRSME